MSADTWQQRLAEFEERYKHGRVTLEPDDAIRPVLNARVPNQYGVYVIVGRRNATRQVCYIGKAGTMVSSGAFRHQGLRERLQAKQQGMSRPEFYRLKMQDEHWDALEVTWIVTFDHEHQTIPAAAEAELLQAYWDTHRRLPSWNETF